MGRALARALGQPTKATQPTSAGTAHTHPSHCLRINSLLPAMSTTAVATNTMHVSSNHGLDHLPESIRQTPTISRASSSQTSSAFRSPLWQRCTSFSPSFACSWVRSRKIRHMPLLQQRTHSPRRERCLVPMASLTLFSFSPMIKTSIWTLSVICNMFKNI